MAGYDTLFVIYFVCLTYPPCYIFYVIFNNLFMIQLNHFDFYG